MGQFKPMVKMETTEPTVELKLKKGGKVEKKMQMGGSPDMAAPAAPSMPARGGMMPPATPMRPSLAARRRAMRAMPSGAAPAAPVGMAGRMMKEGGESKAEHKAEMAKTAKALKEHAGKPASKAHKGLKTGGVVMGQGGYKHGGIINTEGQGGEYRDTKMHDGGKEHKTPKKTGEVVMGKPGGYATGGVAKANAGGYKRGGKIKKMADGGILGPGLMTGTVEAPGKSSSAYGGLEQIRGGAQGLEGALSSISSAVGFPKTGGSPYRKGGAAKKAFATGGVVNSGAPVAMPQGRKKPSAPVSITALSGTFKKGGKVTAAEGRLHKNFEKENATAMKEAKAYSNEVYSKYGKKMAGGGVPSAVRDQRQTEENQRAYENWERSQTQENEAMRNAITGFPRKVMRGIKGLFSSGAPKGSVTETEKSVTVTPSKKRGGAVTC